MKMWVFIVLINIKYCLCDFCVDWGCLCVNVFVLYLLEIRLIFKYVKYIFDFF